MKLGMDRGSLVAWDHETSAWIVVGEAWDHDVLAFLADGESRRSLPRARPSGTESRTEGRARLVFRSTGLAACVRLVGVAHGQRRPGHGLGFRAPGIKRVASGFESLTGKVFPPLKPKGNYYRDPQFYMGNHRSVVAGRHARSQWPSFAKVLDFELESA